ncbi:Hva22-like protein a, partial [Thalictrum thalictroides]
MGFVGFLKLLVRSFDVLAWPVVTIVYPLYASIQAIQTNSHFENQRWLTYWVLCGLIMLFELICARFIGWLPFWPHVKLMTTCWLAIPHFNGAGYAYNHFVRPCFSVNLQTVKNLVRPGQEEFRICESDNFLLVAERYIEEKGSEALEKLIFDK